MRQCTKKLFLKDFNIAVAKNDTAFTLEHVSDDIDWQGIGHKHIQGKAQFESTATAWQDSNVAELTLHSIITHNKEGAVRGTMLMANGDHYDFCEVYEFANIKGSWIKAMTSYVIKVSS